MSISVDVHLLSGKSACLKVATDASVHSLMKLAQTALKVGRGRLLRSSGEVLDPVSSIKAARLQDGDSLTLHVKQVAVAAARTSRGSKFAAILGDGSVVSWEDVEGNSTAVPRMMIGRMCTRSKPKVMYMLQSCTTDL